MSPERKFSSYTYRCLEPYCLYQGKFFLIETVLQCPECSTFLRFPRLGARKLSREERQEHESEMQKEEGYWEKKNE